MLRVALFADHEIGHRIVSALHEARFATAVDLAAVVTTRENGSAWWPSLAEYLKGSGVPFHIWDPADLSFLAELGDADYFLAISWKHLFPREALAVPRHGVVNLHYSLLPDLRGVYPVNWAIIEGRTVTGVTYHWVDEGIDTGPVILQAELPIRSYDTARTLLTRLDDLAYEQFDTLLTRLGEVRRPTAGAPAKSATGYYSKAKFDAADAIDLDRAYIARDLIDLLRGKTFYPYGWNAYYIDAQSGNRVYVGLILDPRPGG